MKNDENSHRTSTEGYVTAPQQLTSVFLHALGYEEIKKVEILNGVMKKHYSDIEG